MSDGAGKITIATHGLSRDLRFEEEI